MTAFEFMKGLKHDWWSLLPSNDEGKPTVSHGQIRRWLERRSVVINGIRPGPDDEITFPIESFVFFPKGKRKTTIR